MSKKEKQSIMIYIIYYLAYSSLYIARMNFSVVSVLFEETGVLNKTQIGWIGSIFAFSYAIAKIPGGYIGDRKPAHKVIICGLVITALSNSFIGFLPHFYTIAIFWCLNAIGQSLLWGPTLRMVNATFQDAKLKILCQWLSSSVAVGSILGLLLASFCTTVLGASACFFLPGGISMLMAFIISRMNKEEKKRSRDDVKKQEKDKMCSSTVKSFLRDRYFHEMIVPAISHGMIKDNINVWLAVYFADTFGIDLKSLAYYVFLIPVFGLAGRMIYPMLYKIFKNDDLISGVAFCCCVLLLIPMYKDGITPVMAMICMGMISAMVSVINVNVLSMFPSRYVESGNVSFVASFMDVLTYGGAGIGSLLFGILIQRGGFESMFSVWGGISALSIICLISAGRRKAKEEMER